MKLFFLLIASSFLIANTAHSQSNINNHRKIDCVIPIQRGMDPIRAHRILEKNPYISRLTHLIYGCESYVNENNGTISFSFNVQPNTILPAHLHLILIEKDDYARKERILLSTFTREQYFYSPQETSWGSTGRFRELGSRGNKFKYPVNSGILKQTDAVVIAITERDMNILDSIGGEFQPPTKPEVIPQVRTPESISKKSTYKSPFESQKFDIEPKIIKLAEPDYPEQARRLRVQGAVILEIEIEEDASVGDIRVLRGLGKSGCNEAAVEAIRKSTFEPGQLNGKPIKSIIRLSVKFNLKESKKELPKPVIVGGDG